MSKEQRDIMDRVELLSWLETMERNFDPLLLKGRNRFNESEGWIGIWLLRSLLGIRYEKMPEDKVSRIINVFSTRWQTWLTYLAGVAGMCVIPNIPNIELAFWQFVFFYGAIGTSLIISMYANLNRMLSMDDPYFNSNAYKLFRRQEYFMFLSYFREHKYTFKTAHEWLKLLYRENGLDSVIAEHKEIQRQWRDMVEELKKSLDEKDSNLKKLETVVKLLNRKLEILQRLAKINEDGFNSAISTIYRLRSSDFLFNTSDLRVVTDFSLFELVEPKLIRLCEQGTTETPKIIDIHDPGYSHYSSVKLVHGQNTIVYATSDREGRTVASYWIDLPSGRTVIYNFHFDSTLEGMNDIIEMKEMYRYIKGICMHLEEQGFLGEEVQSHVAN